MTCGVCVDPALCRDHGCQEEAWEHWLEGQRQTSPSVEEECESRGHEYHSDDGTDRLTGGRCYCGRVRYPAGGPDAIERVNVSERYL